MKIVTALENQIILTMSLMQLPSTTEMWQLLLSRQNSSLCFPLPAGKSLPGLQGKVIAMPMEMQQLS